MNNLFDLKNKNALVTGASSGLGKQFAQALALQGANVAMAARRIDRLDELSKELQGYGVKTLSIKTDVTKELEVQSTVDKVVSEWGKIDIVVNCAGVTAIAEAQKMTLEQWRKVIDTNLTGMFLVCKHAGEKMIAQKYGRIINIASMYGVVGNAEFPVVNYHASKFGAIGITKALAAEWAKYGITVNAIGPGFFESEMTAAAINTPDFQKLVQAKCPMGRIGKPGELNGILVYLASDASSYCTGQIICVDGGWTAV